MPHNIKIRGDGLDGLRVSIDNGKTWADLGKPTEVKTYPSKEQNIKDAFNKLEGEECCNYCRYRNACNGLTLGPNGPIYPPCADLNTNVYMDYELFKEDYLNENEEEINMNKVLELYAEREEKRIKDKYEKLKEDMYDDNLIVKDFKALEDTSKLAYDTLLKKYNTDGNTFITKTGYMYESGYKLSEEIMDNIRESLAPDFNKEMEELYSKVKDIEALLSISDDKDYQLEVLKTYGLIDKKGIIVK